MEVIICINSTIFIYLTGSSRSTSRTQTGLARVNTYSATEVIVCLLSYINKKLRRYFGAKINSNWIPIGLNK